MRISDWSSDVCSSDLTCARVDSPPSRSSGSSSRSSRYGRVGACPATRLQPGKLLCLACQVRRHGGRGRQAAEGARVGEQPPQAPTGRGSPGHRGTEGRLRGKTLAPQRKREAVRRMLELTTLSERRVCRLAGLSRDAFRDSPEPAAARSEEHTSELQSLMRISYAVFCLKQKKYPNTN